MIETFIITAPRDPYYLYASLDSYFYEWSNRPYVFAEPETKIDSRADYQLIRNKKTLGVTGNWLRAAEYMLRVTNTPYIMGCEDDIIWSPESGREIRSFLRHNLSTQSNVGAVSPYCSRMCQPAEQGWVFPKMKNPRSWCGALCLIFERKILERIVANATQVYSNALHPQRENCPFHLDTAVGQWIYEHNLKIMTHNPTFVLHCGMVSTWEKNNKHVNEWPAREPAL